MRPDEHKKKRSSAYKKKHGVVQNKNQREDKTAKSGLCSTTIANLTEKPVGHEQEEESLSPEMGAFKKKPIQSNWDRYKPLSDDEEDLGADYNVLLSFAGDASSHARFKHEEEWDAESTDFNNVLTIDCKHMSRALENIPFCEKYKLEELGIEPHILQLVSEIDDNELQEKSVGGTPSLPTTNASDLGFDFSNFHCVEKKKIVANEITGLIATTNEQQDTLNPAQSSHTEANEILDLSTDGNLTEPDTNQTEAKQRPQVPCPQAALHVNESKLVQVDKSKTEDDRMVDELLSSKGDSSENDGKINATLLSEKTVAQTQINMIQNDPKTQKEDGELDDLEGWLDSIL